MSYANTPLALTNSSNTSLLFSVSDLGDLTVIGNAIITGQTTVVASVASTQVSSFAAATYRSGKLIVQIHDTVTGEVQISEILIVHNGTTATATQYTAAYTGGGALATFTVDIVSGNVRLMATGTTSNSTQYKVFQTLMVA